MARIDANVTRCGGCGDWVWLSKCCPSCGLVAQTPYVVGV